MVPLCRCYDISKPWDAWLMVMHLGVLDPLVEQQRPRRMSTATVIDETPMLLTISPALLNGAGAVSWSAERRLSPRRR